VILIKEKLNKILNRKNLTIYQLSKLTNFSESALGLMIKGKCPFLDKAMKKILSVLEISQEEFESWVIADKYPKEVLKLALEAKKNFPYKRKSVLTANIDSILQQKGMSRTAAAKQIDYSQSGLNRMIIGQISMSKTVIERLSKVLDISETEIKSWIVADKYSKKVLELSIKECL